MVHTLSYARGIDGRTYNVTQWSNVFATRGAYYTITHSAPHNLYATGQDYEPVNGRIRSGRDGRFQVDIPVYSRRAFLHEAEMTGDDTAVTILDWNGAGKLNSLRLATGPDFPKQVLEVYAVYANGYYPMEWKNGELTLSPGGQGELSSLLSPSQLQQFMSSSPYYYASEDEAPAAAEDRFRNAVKPLIAWSLGIPSRLQEYLESPRATDGRVQLFIFARSPQSFSITGSQFGRETGYVLYHVDLFKPGS